MATSNFPNFSTTLLAALKAASWPVSTPQIADGADIVPDVQREFVLVGNCEAKEDWDLLGNKRRNEQMKQYITIRANKVGDTQAATTARAFALMAVIENYVRGDPTIGGTVQMAGLVEWKVTKNGNEGEKYAEIVLAIGVRYGWITQ